MSKLTSRAKREQRRARLKRWVERNIICDDPDEQGAVPRDNHSLWFLCFIILGVAFYLAAGWYIFSR
jgi:hypothetical protein